MASLQEIHSVVVSEIKKTLTLNPVTLKYPFPARPVRALGLIKMDGEVFSSEKLLRVVCLRISLPVYITIYSTFIRPKLEYDLPVLSCEAVCMGSKRIFVLDIHRTGDVSEKDEDTAFFDRLVRIRDSYSDLLKYQKQGGGKGLESLHSRAVCKIKITKDMDERVLQISREYLSAYADLVNKADSLSGDALEKAREAFESYLKTVVDHDPGVKANKIFFGKEEGVERALEMYYGI